jgi:hypothetical protein
MKKIKFILTLFITITLFNCSNDNDSSGNTQDFNYNQGNSVNRNFHGLVLDTSGNPVSNATVTIGSSTVQTNNKGLFVINNASVKERFAYIKVSKTGFIDGSRVVVPTNGDNRINIMLLPVTVTATITTGAPSQVSLPNGSTVKFNGDFKDVNGNAYSGSVQVGLYHLKPSDNYLNEIMPGSLLGSSTNGNAQVLGTLGMLHVDLRGSSGQKLNITSPSEISLEIDATQLSNAPASIPLWSFDEATGIWKEEGSASKVGTKYVGNVSHFSWWNCDISFNLANLTINIQNAAGQPIAGLKSKLTRSIFSWQGQNYTNTLGQSSGVVPANETLTLELFDFCGNVVYTANIGPFSAGSINVLPNIVLSQSVINTITVSGVLKTCSGNNVTNGVVNLYNNSTSPTNFFANQSVLVTNGTFSFTYNFCGTTQQFRVVGDDFSALQTTGDIYFTATSPTTDIGILSTCNTTTEFITYQLDNNPTKYVISNINAGNNGSGFQVISQGSPFFFLASQSINSVGTYTNNFGMEIEGANPNQITGFSNINTVQLIISNYGSVGGYIDFTFNGTFTDSTGNHTISGTGHVIRDF